MAASRELTAAITAVPRLLASIRRAPDVRRECLDRTLFWTAADLELWRP